MMAIPTLVRVERSKSTLVRGSPAYSKRCGEHVGGAVRSATSLLMTHRLQLELDPEVRANDPSHSWFGL